MNGDDDLLSVPRACGRLFASNFPNSSIAQRAACFDVHWEHTQDMNRAARSSTSRAILRQHVERRATSCQGRQRMLQEGEEGLLTLLLIEPIHPNRINPSVG